MPAGSSFGLIGAAGQTTLPVEPGGALQGVSPLVCFRWRRHRRPLVWQVSRRGGRLCLSPHQQHRPSLTSHPRWELPGCFRLHPLSPCPAPSPLRGGSLISRAPQRCGLTLGLLIRHHGHLSGLLNDNVEGTLSRGRLLRLLQAQELLQLGDPLLVGTEFPPPGVQLLLDGFLSLPLLLVIPSNGQQLDPVPERVSLVVEVP